MLTTGQNVLHAPRCFFFFVLLPGLPGLPEERLDVYPVLGLLRPVVVEQLLRREVPFGFSITVAFNGSIEFAWG